MSITMRRDTGTITWQGLQRRGASEENVSASMAGNGALRKTLTMPRKGQSGFGPSTLFSRMAPDRASTPTSNVFAPTLMSKE